MSISGRGAQAIDVAEVMAAHHDVKDLGMAAVKLPDGQTLELPLLQVTCSTSKSVSIALPAVSFVNHEHFTYRTQREIGSWTFESFSQREYNELCVTQTHERSLLVKPRLCLHR